MLCAENGFAFYYNGYTEIYLFHRGEGSHLFRILRTGFSVKQVVLEGKTAF